MDQTVCPVTFSLKAVDPKYHKMSRQKLKEKKNYVWLKKYVPNSTTGSKVSKPQKVK